MKIAISKNGIHNNEIFVLLPVMLASISFFVAYVVEEYHFVWILRIISVGCILFGLIYNKVSIGRLELLFLAGVLLTSLYSMEFDAVFIVGCAAILFRQCSFENISRVAKYVIIALTIILFVGLETGIYANMSTNINGRLRYLLGFNNANVAGSFFFILLTIIFLSRKKVGLVELLLLNAGNAIVYSLTNSRAPFFSFLIMSVIYFFAIRFKRTARIFSYICCVSTFFIVFLVGKIMLILPQLDIILSGRLQKYAPVINNMSIDTLLFGGSPNNMENFYLSFVSIHGIVLLTVMFVIVIRQIRAFYDNCMYKEVAFVLAFLVYGEFENVMSSFDSVATFLFWAYILGKSTANREEKYEPTGLLIGTRGTRVCG